MTQVLPADEAKARIGPQKIRALYEDGYKATQAETRRYWENLAYLQGDQWVYYSKSTNRLEEMPRDESRVRLTVNRLGSTVRRLIAKSCKRALVFEVPPTAADDATVRGARIAEAVLTDLAREQNWENEREEVTIAVLTGGTGLLCMDWDPSAGQSLEFDRDSRRSVGTGDVKVTALAITEAVTEPGTKNIETARYWIKAQALPCKEVQELFGMAEEPAADASTAMSPVQRKIYSADKPFVPQKLCLVLTYYERPCSEYPDGQVCVVIGDRIVDGPYPWPFPFKDRLNVVCARETKVLSRWTGDTILSQAVPVQTALNAAWSSLVEHLKLAANARILWPIGAGDTVESLSDLPAEIIEYMAQFNGVKPEWWTPPQLPNWLMEQPAMLSAQIDDILGQHDVSRGEAPRNVESGSGLAILAEQDDTPVGHVTNEIGQAFARLTSMVLETYGVKVTESRKARVDYPHRVSETVKWSGRELMGQTRAIVPPDAIRPVSQAEVWTKAVNLQQMGAFTGADGKPNMRQFAKYIAGSGGEEDFIEAIDSDVAKANRENADMAIGEPKLPAPFDVHAIHIDVHNDFRKSAAYERMDERSRGLVDMHVQAHETLAAEDAAEAQNRMMQGGPELAMAASANRGGRPELPGVPQALAAGPNPAEQPPEMAGALPQ